MGNSPPKVRLNSKMSSVAWVLVICAIFVAIGIWMGDSEGWIGYAIAGLFGLGVLVGIVQLLPGSSFLELDDNGMTVCCLFRKHYIPWPTVDGFFVIGVSNHGITVHKLVGMNYNASFDRSRLARRFATAIGGCEGALPDTYGCTAEELADKLNAYLRAFRIQGDSAKIGPPSDTKVSTKV